MPAQKQRPRLLFICLKFTTFVEDDLSLLRERYDVRVFHFDADASTVAGRFLKLLDQAMRQFLWLVRELPRADLVYGWFADYHMTLPAWMARMLGVPVAVVLGGMDCNHLPELDYGVRDSLWRAPLAQLVVRQAELLLPVTDALIHSENRYTQWPDRRQDGLKVFVPNLRTPHRVLHTGYDPAAWPLGPSQREPIVSTVALVDSHRTVRVKGIDVYFEVAAKLPEVTFQVVGVDPSFVPALQGQYAPSENVEFIPPRPRHELAPIYARTSVYAQLSRTEGMPNVVCEAMLCGCIPVGSTVAGIPEVIGDAGFLVEQPHPGRIAEVIQEALQQDGEARKRARQRIITCFSREKRRAELLDVLDHIRD